MPPNPQVVQAVRAMKSLGIAEDKVKPVLKSLLKLYEKSWDLIEGENYRVLVDAIFENEEYEGANKKKPVSNEREQEQEDDQEPDEIEQPLKRSRLRYQQQPMQTDNGSSSHLAGTSPMQTEDNCVNFLEIHAPEKLSNMQDEPELRNGDRRIEAEHTISQTLDRSKRKQSPMQTDNGSSSQLAGTSPMQTEDNCVNFLEIHAPEKLSNMQDEPELRNGDRRIEAEQTISQTLDQSKRKQTASPNSLVIPEISASPNQTSIVIYNGLDPQTNVTQAMTEAVPIAVVHPEKGTNYILNKDEKDEYTQYGNEEIDENDLDILYDENVDLYEESIKKIGCSNIRDLDPDIGSDDLAETDDELESINGSDEEYAKENRFDPKTMEDPELFCGLRFKDFKEFKEAVRNYSIKRGRPIMFSKSDKVRCRGKCKKTGCGWNIYARIMQDGKAEIRVFESKHTCSFSKRNSNVRSGWIANKYMTDFTMEPNPNMWNFRKKVMHDNRCRVSKSQAYRARKKALVKLRGSQYNLLQSYIEEVKRNDAEATMVLETTSAEIIEDGNRLGSEHQLSQRFFRLYCCLSALKKGMVVGCRKIFGIDGCHLRGAHGGMLLTAVGIDPNNNLFPIAYAATEGENKDSWIWFLDLLRKDLNIERDFEWTIISDKQNGLEPACEAVFPAADHRLCIRHLHANMVLSGFTGGNLKAAFYQAATATTVTSFTQAMNLIKGISSDAFKWLDGKPPRHWTRSHFSTSLKCDMLLNKVCESFSIRIRDAREMPIISMFENIMNFLMVRFQQKRDMAKNDWGDMKICPRINKKLEKNIELAANCFPYKSSEFIYEFHQCDGMQYDVNLRDMVCSCRKWGLTGIPCPHACAALSFAGSDPEDYVDECYKVDTYKMIYELAIQNVCGMKLLSPTVNQQILPPVYKKQPDRPKKLRKKSQELSRMKKGKGVKKLSRVGLKGRCSSCGKIGHNIRKCPDRMKYANEDGEQPLCIPFESQGSISVSGVIQEGTTSIHGKREEIEVVARLLQGTCSMELALESREGEI